MNPNKLILEKYNLEQQLKSTWSAIYESDLWQEQESLKKQIKQADSQINEYIEQLRLKARKGEVVVDEHT